MKVRTRCGFRPCAAQIRCTLRWLTPAAFAIARPVQCVASPGGSASVISTTRSIVAGGKGGLPAGPGGLMQQAIDTLGHEARLPAPDRRLAFAGLPLDRHRADPVGAQQHNPRPPHMLLRAVPRADHSLKPLAVARTKPDFNACSHPGRFALVSVQWNHSLAPIH